MGGYLEEALAEGGPFANERQSLEWFWESMTHGWGGFGGLLQITSPWGGPGEPLGGLESRWSMVLPDMERRGPWGAVTCPGGEWGGVLGNILWFSDLLRVFWKALWGC